MDMQGLRPWLALFHTEGLMAGDWSRLLRCFGSARAALEAGHARLQQAGIDSGLAARLLDSLSPSSPARQRIEADLEWMDAAPHRAIISLESPEYPPLLRQIALPPPLLYLQGLTGLLRRSQVAIVGSRKASPYGEEMAFTLAAELGRAGLIITSGLAEGIDTRAHRGALGAGAATIAVLGNGMDQCFPRSNRPLAAEVRQQGLLVSEFARHTPPRAMNFPRRNRIISGLALGVLVIEATRRSGSLITARLAAEQNREVFALPGSVRNPQSRGCHQLLKEGAALVENGADVLENLPEAWPVDSDRSADDPDLFGEAMPPVLEPGEHAVYRHIGADPVGVDRLSPITGLDIAALSRILLQLEIRGRIARSAGGYIRSRNSR